MVYRLAESRVPKIAGVAAVLHTGLRSVRLLYAIRLLTFLNDRCFKITTTRDSQWVDVDRWIFKLDD